MMKPAATLQQLLDLFEKHGDDTYGEGVTQLQHALQCAALAQLASADDALVAAVLLHDVGHFIIGAAPENVAPNIRHEQLGAEFLTRLFDEDVTAPIALHVTAKRYQCTHRPDYQNALSAASKRSLKQQGGLLSASEYEAFIVEPHFDAAMKLRAWDDSGKLSDAEIPCLQHYMPLLEGLLKQHVVQVSQ